MKKRIFRSALALIISVTILPLGNLVSYAEEETSNVVSEGIVAATITQSDYTQHIANETLPSKAGYLFAGWYTDSTFADVLTKSEGAQLSEDATVCAKFVDGDVLTVKAQVEIKEDGAKEKADIRFVTTVDSLDYQKMGFKIIISDREGVKDRDSRTVYRQLYQIGETSEDALDVISPKSFSEASTFFYTYSFWNIPDTSFGTEFTVTPYWVTLDGTTVEGTTAIKTVNGGYEYSGDWDFDTSYKYICNEPFMFVAGTKGTDYEQPYVENGMLNLSLKKNTRTVCFSAADLIKAGYCAGDDVKVTVRIKPDNASQFKIYTAPRGSGDSYINFLKDKVNADSEGWYTYTYMTKINDKRSNYLYDPNNTATDYANIGFLFMWNGDANVGKVLFDYIKVEPVSDGWEFANTDLPLNTENIHVNAASTMSVENGKLSVTSSNGWSAIRISASKLLSIGYNVGDDIRVTMRIKPTIAGSCTFYGAPYGSGWTNQTTSFVVNDMLQESCAIHATLDAEGYYTFSYDTKINAKESDWLYQAKENDAEWANVGIMFNFGNAATKNVLIDYIRVESIGDGWRFTEGDSPLSEEISTNANTVTQTEEGHLKLSVTNTGTSATTGWGFMSLSAQELIDAGYQVGDKIRVTIRMKSSTPAITQFSGAASSSEWDDTKVYLYDAAIYDGEYSTLTYETTISGSKGELWKDNTSDTRNSIRFRFAFHQLAAGATRDVEIDYIRVEAVTATE